MQTEQCIVNNHVFLLGLDKFYRDVMKQHERGELLVCAQRVAGELYVVPEDIPVEGYYAEDEKLTEYFQLMQALLQVDENRAAEVKPLTEFCRLLDVTSSPLYGQTQLHGMLLPAGRDPMSQALINTQPHWSLDKIITAAYTNAYETDDYSLAGLAARIKDPVVLTALRESVVLYAEMVCIIEEPPQRKYVWGVDDDLASQAKRFIDTFNSLFNEKLPAPEPNNAELYWHACSDNEILGRCVRLGCDETQTPLRYYHWAICLGEKGLTVQEFWHTEIWTTTRYCQALEENGPCLGF